MATFNALAPSATLPLNAMANLATSPQDKVDPYDFTQKNNTSLDSKDEKLFMKWAEKTGKIRDLYDYDLRGFWKSGAGLAENGHGSDMFKKPNHPTFSDQSQYNTPETTGGTWAQTPKGQTMFTPSSYNLQNMSAPSLQKYFKQVEPNVMLNLPVR